MAQRLLYIDGREIRAISVGQLQRILLGQAEASEDVDVVDAYAAVAWLYRSVQVRADNVAAMPYTLIATRTGNAVDPADPQYASLRRLLADLLWRIEAALCLYAAAYCVLETNKWGLNLSPRWLLPSSVSPTIDDERGLIGFKRTLRSGRTVVLSLDEVLYWWVPSLTGETGPGTAPGDAALSAAGVLFNSDRMIEGFFKRGAVKVTLLSVPPGTPPQEVKRVERWWKRLVSGIANAYQTIVVKSDLKPVTIGGNLEEAQADQMTERKREDVAVAMGVPPALLYRSSAYATARHEDRLAFVTSTVIPECNRIEGGLNRWLVQIGLYLQWTPERLEVMQTAQLEQAQAVGGLTEGPILNRDEARDLLGYGPWTGPKPEFPAASEPVRGLSPAALADLRRWRTKVKRRGPDVPFASAAIPPDLAAHVRAALASVGDAAFAFLRDEDAERARVEGRLRKALADALSEHLKPTIDAILEGKTDVPLGELRDKLLAVLGPELAALAVERALRIAAEVGVQFDPAVINQAALEWAKRYSYGLVAGIVDATRAALAAAIAQFVATPGMTREALETLLSPSFGPVRAEMIAVTEVTRAYSQATNQYQQMLDDAGLRMVRYWWTRRDDQVCAICGPLNGEPEDRWLEILAERGISVDPAEIEDGPPAHIRCRCGTVLRYVQG